jgi:hypothetical protein
MGSLETDLSEYLKFLAAAPNATIMINMIGIADKHHKRIDGQKVPDIG